MLTSAKKSLEDREKQKPESSKNNSNKLNWAIGLGIAAIVIGLICLILLASRKKER